MRLFGETRAFPLLSAMNLVTSKPASDMALAAPGPRRPDAHAGPLARSWRSSARASPRRSSNQAPYRWTPPMSTRSSTTPTYAFPALKLTSADVTLVHRGLVPAIVRGGRPDLKPSPEIVDHGNGSITVIGVKFTTARAVAERAARVVARRLGRRLPASRTAITPLPGAAIADHEALAIETGRALHMDVPLPVIRHLIRLYAERAAEIIHLTHDRPDLQDSLTAGNGNVEGGSRSRHPARNGASPLRHRPSPNGSGIGRRAAARCLAGRGRNRCDRTRVG